MTSPYITFEEMEEGKWYVAFRSNDGRALNSDSRYFKKGGELFFEDDGYGLKSYEHHSQLVFIPVYTHPKSYEKYLDGGNFYSGHGCDSVIMHYFREKADSPCLKAAIDWLQDELDRRKKAGES